MPRSTFFNLPEERRNRLVREAITEFAERAYVEASLSQIAVRARIPKGSFYQYFEDKLDLYRWLLTEEVPRRKQEFLGVSPPVGGFWARLEHHVERGMAFLVEHPRLARLTAAAADPSAIAEVRGLHRSICEAGVAELRALLEEGVAEGAIRTPGADLEHATRLVSAVIGPGLTDLVLQELGAELHEVLGSDSLRRRLGGARRRRLAAWAIQFIRGGLDTGAPRSSTRKRQP
ncbi:TetR/AcrR family transcriptional regulator [Myxococcus sp. K15C18031901]|uniref:TetR/AcrR family transcriptional regulator n=1 Tax=Myxococcus dinghuensis TaxID=2906761 RepID=UPI0020A7273A|nr:TetR/AcrR family transcriptional regulator [Myxococcus dinghuensis]MCP3101602.1 TetR/AcrR family transcriptional regulator [Myxococcus dinghuensis]